MRRYESVTGHIRCTVYRTRLFASALSTGSIDVHTTRRWHAVAGLQAGLPSGCPAFRPDYNRAFRPVKPLGLTVIGPSGPIARSHKRSGPAPVVVIDAAVAVDAASPNDAIPMPPRRFEYWLDCKFVEALRSFRAFELVGLALDPCEPYAGLVELAYAMAVQICACQ